MVYAYLVEDGAQHSFLMAPFDTLPRVGEMVSFHFAAYDEEKWNPESWQEMQEVDLTDWRVKRVNHRVRRNSIDTWGTHIVDLIVERVKDE